MNLQEFHTIQGYVQALPRSLGKEEPARVAVITEDGTEYRILHKGAGAGLFANINANVEVVGRVDELPPAETDSADRDDAGPVRLVTVKSYRLTDGFDDPWYDDAVG